MRGFVMGVLLGVSITGTGVWAWDNSILSQGARDQIQQQQQMQQQRDWINQNSPKGSGFDRNPC